MILCVFLVQLFVLDPLWVQQTILIPEFSGIRFFVNWPWSLDLSKDIMFYKLVYFLITQRNSYVVTHRDHIMIYFFKNQTLIPFPMKTYVSLFGVEVGQGNTYIFGRRFKPKKYRNKRNTSFIMLRKMCFTSHHSFPTFITVGTAWIMSWWSSHARFKTNSR